MALIGHAGFLMGFMNLPITIEKTDFKYIDGLYRENRRNFEYRPFVLITDGESIISLKRHNKDKLDEIRLLISVHMENGLIPKWSLNGFNRPILKKLADLISFTKRRKGQRVKSSIPFVKMKPSDLRMYYSGYTFNNVENDYMEPIFIVKIKTKKTVRVQCNILLQKAYITSLDKYDFLMEVTQENSLCDSYSFEVAREMLEGDLIEVIK